MIPTPWLLVGVLAALAVAGAVGYMHGAEMEQGRQARFHTEAVAAARAQERAGQKRINDAIQEQADEDRRDNAFLNAELERLRSRPDRRVPSDPGIDCQGATGAELSSRDAAAFARLAARADRLRSGLRACYAYVDSLTARP